MRATLTPGRPKRNWRIVVIGLCAAATGVGIVIDSLHSLRTGEPIVVSVNRRLPTDWWYWLPIGLLTIVIGLWAVGAALGFIRTKPRLPEGRR